MNEAYPEEFARILLEAAHEICRTADTGFSGPGAEQGLILAIECSCLATVELRHADRQDLSSSALTAVTDSYY